VGFPRDGPAFRLHSTPYSHRAATRIQRCAASRISA
jgi:hypothetical protein